MALWRLLPSLAVLPCTVTVILPVTGDLLYSSYGILCTRRIRTLCSKLCVYVCTFL